MGFGPFSSESTAKQTTQTVSDSGQLNTKSTVAQGGSLLLGKGSNYVAPGSLNFAGAKGDIIFNTSADEDIITAALDKLGDLNSNYNANLQNIFDQAAAANAAAAAASGGNLDKVLSTLTPLAESKQTDGESGRNNVVLWVFLAIAAVAGIYFWRKG